VALERKCYREDFVVALWPAACVHAYLCGSVVRRPHGCRFGEKVFARVP
jgi:hypothetical protein